MTHTRVLGWQPTVAIHLQIHCKVTAYDGTAFLAAHQTFKNSDRYHKPMVCLCAGAVVCITAPGTVLRKTSHVCIIAIFQTFRFQIRTHIVSDRHRKRTPGCEAIKMT